ncbi:MAG: hypothetical protein U9Q90_05065 [Campylobacterota bacterium]|nr:hypothetical protein [Campylobacterota bacterium]
MNLAQKILTLDAEAEAELQNVSLSTLKRRQEADAHADRMREEQQQFFEDQKRKETAELTKKLEEDRQKAIAALRQKMKAFDKEVEINKLAEYLLSMAKERACR